MFVALDLVTSINYNNAKEVNYVYNATGDLVQMTDWLGTTTFEVDLLHQLTSVIDHKGNVVTYAYDSVGNQTAIHYPDGTTATYDGMCRAPDSGGASDKDKTKIIFVILLK